MGAFQPSCFEYCLACLLVMLTPFSSAHTTHTRTTPHNTCFTQASKATKPLGTFLQRLLGEAAAAHDEAHHCPQPHHLWLVFSMPRRMSCLPQAAHTSLDHTSTHNT